MAVPSLPTIQTSISGDGVTQSIKTTKFTLGEKIEYKYAIKLSDGNLVVDLSRVNDIKTIIFNSDYEYTINFDIDLSLDPLTPDIVTVPFECAGSFRFDPQSVFIDKLSSLSIATSSETNIFIDINIYGEE